MKRSDPITTITTTDVMKVHVGQKLSAVAELLRENAFRHVPVMDGERPVGMISATDIFKIVYDPDGTDERMTAAILDHEHSISSVMSSDLKVLPRSATVHDAATMLSSGEFGAIVVVDDDGKLAGVVTTVDLIRYLRDGL